MLYLLCLFVSNNYINMYVLNAYLYIYISLYIYCIIDQSKHLCVLKYWYVFPILVPNISSPNKIPKLMFFAFIWTKRYEIHQKNADSSYMIMISDFHRFPYYLSFWWLIYECQAVAAHLRTLLALESEERKALSTQWRKTWMIKRGWSKKHGLPS